MQKNLLLACIIVFSFFSRNKLEAQVKFIEKVESKDNQIIIPYEKYKLSNGMTVLIHIDKSDPIVHVDVTYHVGSAREEVGRSGFAHFFEHMMFQGSDHVADEEHFKIVTEAGGTMNGTTNTDRTNYFQTLPSNQLEVAMWLEADRMGFLLDAVTQQKFEIQRATVKNERGQNYDNRPYGLVFEKTLQALYPFGHPYSWPTIGYLVDLDRVTVDDLKRFFLRWYGPNNAVLTVAGDVNKEDVLKFAEKYFGSIPRGPEVKNMPKSAAKLDKNRYISYEDNIKFHLLSIVFPTVHASHPDEQALDLLAKIIGGGNTSMLHQKLVKSGKALQANAMNPAFELAGFMQFRTVVQNITLTEAEQLIRETLTEFEKRGVTDDDLEQFKNSTEAALISSLSTVAGKASKLASYETYFNNPNHIINEIEATRKLKKEDVIRVYNKYIKDKPAVILSVVPKGQGDQVAKPDNFTPKLSSETAGSEGKEYKNLKYNKAVDNFDRSKKPSAGPNPVINIPKYWQQTFNNGFKVIGIEEEELPMVSLLIDFKAGHYASTYDDAGIAEIVAQLLNKSTQHSSAESLEEALEKLGSRITFGAEDESNYVYVFALTKNLDATLKILEEKLLFPAFKEDEFELIKKRTIASISDASTKPKTIADNVFGQLLYGETDIRGISTSGNISSINNITLDDVKAFYQKWFNPTAGTIVVVGDVKESEIISKISFLRDMSPKEFNYPTFVDPSKPAKTIIYFVDKPDAPQSEIRIGHPSLKFDATGEYFRANIMNYVLGGAFNSRINLNLREKRGFTYGARSSYSGNAATGRFLAYAGVKADKTDSSLIEFFFELSNYLQNGITDEELIFTKNSIGQRDALKYESPFQKTNFLSKIMQYSLPRDYTIKQNEILASLTKNDINGLAKRYLNLDQMYVLVVGDKKLIFEGIKALGCEIIELDADGKTLN